MVEPYTERKHSGLYSHGTTLGGGDDRSLGSTSPHVFPSLPQSQSPASLLLGRHICMSFKLPVGAISTRDGTLSNTDPVQKDWSHLRPLFCPGELVLIRAGPIPKGASPYKGPLKMEKVLGCYTFMLSDGQRWSTCHMKRWYEPLPTTYLELVTKIQEEPSILRKSSRLNISIPPAHYKP